MRSLVLPFVVVLVVPFLQVARFDPFRIRYVSILPYLQIPIGLLLIGLGLFLLIVTIRLFIGIGKGTLAPWDPTSTLVTQGVYSYVRNPMISGVNLMILGESILLGSWMIFVWFMIFTIVNTIYFKLFEEPGLIQRFDGDYEKYRANVPMWIPRLNPWRSDNHQSGKWRSCLLYIEGFYRNDSKD